MGPAFPLDQVFDSVLELGVAPLFQQSLGGVNPLRLVQRLEPHLSSLSSLSPDGAKKEKSLLSTNDLQNKRNLK